MHNYDSSIYFFLLQLIGKANSVIFLSKVRSCTNDQFKKSIIKLLQPGPLLGHVETITKAWQQAGLHPKAHPIPAILMPFHVFTVHEELTNEGFIIPVSITPSREWQVSDAFGTFGNLFQKGTPIDCLMALLAQVENCWEKLYQSILPARWLRFFNLRICQPVHIEIFDGQSMQVPLLVALLRALAADYSGTPSHLPISDGPVFSTGTIANDGCFGMVANVKEKLEGFIRELGLGCPAILTQAQIDQLKKENFDLSQVRTIRADCITDLIQIGDIQAGLQRLCESYHPTANEGLVRLSISLSYKIEFEEVQRLAKWVLSHVKGPYYRFQFMCDLALTYFHRGQFINARELLIEAQNLFMKYTDYFGANDLAFLFVNAGDLAIDAHDPSLINRIMRNKSTDLLDGMSGTGKAKYYGMLCQYHAMFGQYTEAIEYGRNAVRFADVLYTSTAARARNYLIHAIIIALREGHSDDNTLLSEASGLLQESLVEWAPRDNAQALVVHQGFCLPLQAELARLSHQPFPKPASLHRLGEWSHPWLFTLLSCFRNRENDLHERKECLQELVRGSEQLISKNGRNSLFGLFHAVYMLLEAAFSGTDLHQGYQTLIDWLEARAKEGLPGWRDYLVPLVDSQMPFEKVEKLCDAIRYH